MLKPKYQIFFISIFTFTIFFTFHLVTLSWVYFRADNMDTAHLILSRIFTGFDIGHISEYISSYWIIYSFILVAFVIHWLPSLWKEKYRGFFIKMPLMVKIAVIILVVFIVYQTQSSEIQPFIYFQF